MKKISILFTLLICITAGSCKKEETPSSAIDKLVGHYAVVETWTIHETIYEGDSVIKDETYTYIDSTTLHSQIVKYDETSFDVNGVRVSIPPYKFSRESIWDTITVGGFYNKYTFYYNTPSLKYESVKHLDDSFENRRHVSDYSKIIIGTLQ